MMYLSASTCNKCNVVTNARGVEKILPLEGYNSPGNPQQGIINPRGSIEL
jgi:hypothetical protein